MKKILFIAFLAVFAAITASAQDTRKVKDTWEKTITVPNSQATIIEKLFTAWGKEFPGSFVDAFNQFKKTGKANLIIVSEKEGVEKYAMDFNVDFAPKNGYLEMYEKVENGARLTAVYWNLQNGNKLFGIFLNDSFFCDDSEEITILYEKALMFYEYDATKGTLTPRPEISQKVLSVTDYPHLPKEGRDIEYWDNKTQSNQKLKWNGNGF